MKNTIFSITFICSIFIMMTIGCERTDLQKSISNSNGVVSSREITACDQCPNETDCCCYIELQDPQNSSASLALCGTTDAAGGCSAPSPPNPCSAISGGGQSTGTLDVSDPKFGFCMVPGNSFYVRNLSSGLYADIIICCQDDITHPQKLFVSIPPSTIWYFNTNGECELIRCQ